MTLDMLFSTFGERVEVLAKNLPQENEKVTLIICHQTTQKLSDSVKNIFEARNDVKYFALNSVGVTKSRNFAMEKSSADIIMFCDDDVQYSADVYENVSSAYISNPSYGFITFAYTKTGLGLHKFSNSSFSHNSRTILNVGTIEVTCKRENLKNVKKWFPEDMGAGAKYYLCDEPVFLSRLLKSGLKGRYVPITIGEHPPESSGVGFKDINALVSRMYCFTRIFGSFVGRLLYLVFILKNYPRFKNISLFCKSLTVFFKKVD